MRYGLARGVYANEAGYGTAAVAYGTARSDDADAAGAERGHRGVRRLVRHLVDQRAHHPRDRRRGQSGLNSTAVVAQAFNTAIPVAGGWIVAFCAFLFGYTTLIGWAYYGEQFFEYILGVARHQALSLGLLPADRLRRDGEGRDRLGVGRPDERPAGVSEHHRSARSERPRRSGGATTTDIVTFAALSLQATTERRERPRFCAASRAGRLAREPLRRPGKLPRGASISGHPESGWRYSRWIDRTRCAGEIVARAPRFPCLDERPASKARSRCIPAPLAGPQWWPRM